MTDESCTQPEGAGPQYERSESRPKLARHLVACTPCSADLDAMAAEREVLGYLGKRRQEGGQHGLVERVLAASAEEGRQRLADLLYELGRASLALSPEMNAETRPALLRFIEEPQPAAEIASNLGIVESRLMSLGEQGTSEASGIDATGGFRATAACLDALSTVEGQTDRQRLLFGALMLCEKRPETALGAFQAVERNSQVARFREWARKNLVTALLHLGRHQAAVDQIHGILEGSPDDRWALVHLAIACAWMGDMPGFDDAAARYAVSPIREPDASWWPRLLDHEVDWMASRTNRSIEEIRHAFGKDVDSEGRGS